jgi:flagellar biosynthesis protein FlhF
LPGVGKTTSLFKMAKLIKNRNEKLMLLSLDQRISSVAYMKEMSLKLKCEAKIIKDPKELYKIVHKEIDRTKILIDTPGDEKITYASELKNLLKDTPIKKCLLMDASMTISSSIKTIRNVDSTVIDCIAFSKIDLACNYGNLYNLHVYSGKPISFVTSGGYENERAMIFPPSTVSNLIIGGICEN